MNGGILAEAAGLFAAANVDDILVLSLFFGRSAGQPGAVRRIVVGQYLGFCALIVITVAGAYGATFLPESAVAYLGLLPLALGLRAAWHEWRQYRSKEDEAEPSSGPGAPKVLHIAVVTFANGSDDIGLYLPIFARSSNGDIAIYIVVFVILVAVWCAAGWYFATRAAVVKMLSRWGDLLYPLVLIGLGLSILVQGGAFGL